LGQGHWSSIVTVIRRILVLPALLTLISNADAQRIPDEREITISFSNIPLDSALLLLSTSSNVNISWDTDIIPADKRVSLAAKERNPPPAIRRNAIISGRIKDEQGEYLVYANIYTEDLKYNTVSNEYGFYSMTLPSQNDYNIEYSSVAFEPQSKFLSLSRDTTVDITLSSNNFLNEVVIVAETPHKPQLTEHYDEMPIHLLSSMASLAGEADLIRMAQMRSGVTAQADGFGGLQVRGGSVDQNLMLLDGVPVYNTGHAFGLFSVFNSSVVKSAKLIKGGIPARYGGRLSSVFDVRVKEGSNQQLKGDFAISPLIARASLEGPIAKGKSSFLISGRRTIVDPWLKPLSRYQFERNDEEGVVNFFFYDLNAKVNFDLGDNDQIFLSGYIGKDFYKNEVLGSIETSAGDVVQEFNRNHQEWGNKIATLRWTHNFSNRVFGTAAMSFTSFLYEDFKFDRTIVNPQSVSPTLGYGSRLFASNIEDRIASYDLDWYANKFYHLRVGGSYTAHQITPGANFSQTEDQLLDDENNITKADIQAANEFNDLTGSELRAYAENEFKVGKIAALNLGAHFSSIKTGERTYTSIQPRASAKINIGNKTSVKLGYTQMDQYFHLLSSSGLGLPSDVWLPSTDILSPEKSTQYSGSLSTRLFKDIDITLGVYDKTYSSVTGTIVGGPFDITSSSNWEEVIPTGRGESRGAEVEISKTTGRIKGWISYTYGESTRTFESINEGERFRANSDRAHMLNISLLGRINDNLEITTAWVYGSSAPTTTPSRILSVPINGEILFLPLYTRVNNDNLPSYHRLDVGVNFYSELSWGRQRLSFGAYNAYGKDNPFYVDLVQDLDGGTPKLEQVSILPFLPYISVGISF